MFITSSLILPEIDMKLSTKVCLCTVSPYIYYTVGIVQCIYIPTNRMFNVINSVPAHLFDYSLGCNSLEWDFTFLEIRKCT